MLGLLAASLPALLNSQTTVNTPAQPVLPRFIQPDAKILISIDWKRLQQASLGASLRDKFLQAGGTISTTPGAEFITDIDRMFLSSTGSKPGDNADDNPPVLITISGHFDLAKVRAALTKYGAKPQLFNSIQVYRPQDEKGKDMAFVPVDARTLVFGDASSVFAALERNTSAPASSPINTLAARAAEMDAAYDAWLIATDPQELAGSRLNGILGEGGLAAGARGIEAGISLRTGLSAEIMVRFDDEPAAKMLASEMGLFLKTVAGAKAGQYSLADLAKKLKFTAEGPVTKISLHLTAQEVENGVEAAVARMRVQPHVAVNVRPLNTPSPAAPKKQENQVIRIEGLDDGPRVIPYNQR